MTGWEPVIGLEVHAQLATESKLFCGCSTSFGAPANHQTCPLCMGMPGTLPVLNQRAVEYAVRLGKAVGATIHSPSVFARKNYFYPDLPKGYQISQFDKPICTGGGVWIETEERGRRFIRLNRIHMEEDAGMSSHQADGSSAVDLNRSGVPLCEIVSEADIRSSAEAIAYMKAMRSILRYTEVSDGNMEEGSFRCDANVSIRPAETEPFGTKVELKNINSFRFVGQAIEYEIARQATVLEGGGVVDQETRRWDPKQGISLFMRGKEDAHDYRYFPEPDLGPLVLDPAWVEAIASALPELPDARALRLVEELGLPPYDAQVLTAEKALADYFETAVGLAGGRDQAKALSNWIMGDLLRLLKDEGLSIGEVPVSPQRLVQLLALIDAGEISGTIGKKVFEELWKQDADPADIVQEKGWKQVSDKGAIEAAIREVLDANPGQVEAYRGGKTKIFGFFVGQVMKATRGQANPGVVNELLRKLLDE
ncbi:MAG: Asp-tRNA(Asn)/Glu-tRNA(Gln) amidotransferase subunit GatB [Myxococcota bacterium]|nr:Asp-tRNA(Asn)/Glu-tRNA(Gln) amidotransferase subunit GatB [Myxococcota bacterium]